MTSGICTLCADQRVFSIIQREILLLVALGLAAVPLFLFTRSMAALNRERNARAAATWYELGQRQLRTGDTEASIASFQSATVNNRENSQYLLGLARALAAARRDEEARQALLRLRNSAPENPEINLELARLAAKRKDVTQALLYYHHALYGLWNVAEEDEKRRQVRMELIHFLLDRQDRSRALSGVLVLGMDLPANVASRIEVARLLLQAGDEQRAFRFFTDALRLDRKNSVALAGAGEASFQMGDYGRARRYLEAALEQDRNQKHAGELLETIRMVLSHDPMAPGLTTKEGDSRLIAGFDQAMRRLEGCREQHPARPGATNAELDGLRAQALEMQSKLTPGHLKRDPELRQAAMELTYRIEEAARRICGEPTGLDLALLLIGRKYGMAEP